MFFSRLVFPLAAVAALGACSSPQISNESPHSLLMESIYTYGAAERDLKLEVTGNPFAMDQTAFARAVEKGLPEGSILQPATRPRLAPDTSARPGYRLVLAFQPPAEGSAEDLCAGRVGQTRIAQSISVDAAFCVGTRPYSWATGRVEANSPDDPGFQGLLRQLTISVFHQDEPITRTGGGDAAAY